MNKDISFYSSRELRELILSKQISPTALTHHFLERIQRLNPKLNAYLLVTADEALEAAKKAETLLQKGEDYHPLLGIPIAISDNLDMKGYPTTHGSLLLKDNIAEMDSFTVARLKANGAIILGKTNLSEFSFYPSTENRLGPPCCNPRNLAYTSGGGCGGSAAAIAAGLATIALGSDTQGSVRLPSSHCGIIGLKPTRGRIPLIRNHAVAPAEKMLFQEGLMARSVDDIALALQVLAKPVGSHHESYGAGTTSEPLSTQRKLRIGFSRNFGFISADLEVLEKCERALKLLEEAGHIIQEVDINLDQGIITEFCDLLATDKYLSALSIQKQRPGNRSQFTEYVQWWLQHAKNVTGLQYSAALMMLSWVTETIDAALEKCDLLVTPSSLTAPFLLAEYPTQAGGKSINSHVGLWSFNFPCNMSGHPAINIPCGISRQGLPIGIQAIGHSFHEESLLHAAKTFQTIFKPIYDDPVTRNSDFERPL